MESQPDYQVPCSPLEEIGGVVYLPRMLDKIRLQARGVLRPDLHANLGKGLDGWLCDFLRIDYAALQAEVLGGKSDEAILAWCQEQTRELSDVDRLLWRSFALKLGWNDHLSELLVRRKAESGLQNRDDIQTMASYIDADEGRS